MKMVTKHFSLDELGCTCCKEMKVTWDTLQALEALRCAVGAPLVVSSGYRCYKFNLKIGGVKNSQHCQGTAIDILCTAPSKRFKIIHHALKIGFKGIGVYKNFIHIDLRTATPVIWNG